jgi:hypothetical protein
MTAGDQGMADDGVADFHSVHALADFLDPPGVFVAHNVGEINLNLAAPNAFDDVQVGSTHAGAADPYNDIRRLTNLRIGHVFVCDEFLPAQILVVRVQDGGLHVSSRF